MSAYTSERFRLALVRAANDKSVDAIIERLRAQAEACGGVASIQSRDIEILAAAWGVPAPIADT